MKQPFQRIGLAVKHRDANAIATLKSALAYLAPKGFEFVADAALLAHLDRDVAQEGRLEETDLVLVVGGDGTMLHTARRIAPHGVPLVGVNAGRLGFLADISPAALTSSLDAVLDGNYIEEDRSLLEARLVQDGGETWTGTALNDVVVQKTDGGRMIEFETHVDGSYVCRHRADGIIISTPTGSTAYALSAGGPILHPRLDALAIVPICPHTLSDRPIVVNGDATVEIRMRDTESTDAQVVVDGQDHATLRAGDHVAITAGSRPARLLHPAGHDYYSLLRNKLHWGRDHESGRER